MILTDREIQIALGTSQIIIDPEPPSAAYSSTSVDLTLDSHVAIFQTGKDYVKKVIDPTHKDFDVEEALKEVTRVDEIDPVRGYDLPTNTFILGWTTEYVKLPVQARLAARVEKFTRAAGHWHPCNSANNSRRI